MSKTVAKMYSKHDFFFFGLDSQISGSSWANAGAYKIRPSKVYCSPGAEYHNLETTAGRTPLPTHRKAYQVINRYPAYEFLPLPANRMAINSETVSNANTN